MYEKLKKKINDFLNKKPPYIPHNRENHPLYYGWGAEVGRRMGGQKGARKLNIKSKLD